MEAEKVYKVWLTSLYGSYDGAVLKGVKPWVQLPEKARKAWVETVAYVECIVCKSSGVGCHTCVIDAAKYIE